MHIRKYKTFLLVLIAIFVLFGAIYLLSRLYLCRLVILDIQEKERIGSQLFQYAASFTIAKKTNSKLYVFIEDEKINHGYNRQKTTVSALEYFNIPKENLIYKNRYNRAFLSFLSNKNIPAKIIRSIFGIKTRYVDEENFFRV